MKATFYTIADATFFVGAVVLVNSLRLTGHADEIVLVDRGLTPHQRRRLATQCRIVDPPRREGPMKNAYRLAEDELAVLVDSDMMVTASLGPLLREATDGRIVAFVDGWADRRFDDWQATFQLPTPPRRQPYVNSGFLAFSTSRWPDLMHWWGEAIGLAVDAKKRHQHLPDDATNPFVFNDQDSMNAVLMTYVAPGAVAAHDARLAPIRKGMTSVRVSNPRTLACENDGRATLLLHCTNRPKPWEPRGWVLRPYAAYVDLLPRVLFAGDVAVRIEPGEVPLWLRGNLLGRGARATLATTRRSWRTLERALPSRARDLAHSKVSSVSGERR